MYQAVQLRFVQCSTCALYFIKNFTLKIIYKQKPEAKVTEQEWAAKMGKYHPVNIYTGWRQKLQLFN